MKRKTSLLCSLLLTGFAMSCDHEGNDPRVQPPTQKIDEDATTKINSLFLAKKTDLLTDTVLSATNKADIDAMKLLYWARPDGVPVAEIDDHVKKIDDLDQDLPEIGTNSFDALARVYLLHRQFDVLSTGKASRFDQTTLLLKDAYLGYTTCDAAASGQGRCYLTMAEIMIKQVSDARKD